MLLARFGTVLLLASALGIAKSPTDSSTVCDRFQRSDIIFTGSAEGPYIALFDTGKSPIHKRSEKSKRVRFLVREWYKGQRHDFMDIWMTPSECPLKIEANQMYLIYAHNNKDNGRIESNACMGTIPAATATAELAYLNASLRGPGRATRISGSAGGEGVNVQAKYGIDARYAITDAAGKFTFDGLRPGDWELSIVGGSAQQVSLAPDSCVVQDLH
jgi:hypothetical protein